jgi:hypothetical protein
MNFKHTVVALAIGVGFIGSSQAAVYTFDGNTGGAPTYDRLIESLDIVSPIGVDVNYNALGFSVDVSGDYSFASLASGGWDNFTFLYGPSFNPSAPLVAALRGNDDLDGIGSSGFNFDLTAGARYIFVTTGFSDIDFGAYSNTISGPGNIVPIPEPATYALMLAGLGALVWMRRRPHG